MSEIRIAFFCPKVDGSPKPTQTSNKSTKKKNASSVTASGGSKVKSGSQEVKSGSPEVNSRVSGVHHEHSMEQVAPKAGQGKKQEVGKQVPSKPKVGGESVIKEGNDQEGTQLQMLAY